MMDQKPLAKTEIFDIKLDAETASNDEKLNSVLKKLESVLNEYNLSKQTELNIGDDRLIVFSSNRVHAVIRTHKAGLITFSLEEPYSDNVEFEDTKVEDLLNNIKNSIQNVEKAIKLFYIKRGLPIDVYAMTTDRRIVEYDFDKVLFEENSKFQHIRLVHSPSFGNMLWLDNLQNLAEEDVIYTHCLMNKGHECYKNKNILILGGGDGALLNELLKEDPKFVTMVDIDQMVMDQCKIHLRSACGDVLDNYNGNNYKIIVDDALKVMEEYVKEGRRFDFVFNDLTDVPVSLDPINVYWNLIERILKLTLPLLIKDGKYYNHATNFSAISSLQMYETLLDTLTPKVKFRKYDAHVPSFMERWVFYEVKKVE